MRSMTRQIMMFQADDAELLNKFLYAQVICPIVDLCNFKLL